MVDANISTTKLLALSFSYPPSALPRAVQVARLLRYTNLPTVLVCADHQERGTRTDPQILENAEGFLTNCLRVPFVVSTWRNLIGNAAYRFDLPIWDKIPDNFTPWRPCAMKAIKNFLLTSTYAPNVLVTFGSPMSDHLIGFDLKKSLRLPWIAHFSDPWVDNPFAASDAGSRAINRLLERKVLSAADRIVFTSRETVDLVMAKYPCDWRNRVRIVPHAFEPNLFPRVSKTRCSEITIRYLGDFYGPRTPAPLFNALDHLIASNPAAVENVHFDMVGTLGDLRLEKLGLFSLPNGLVNVEPPVSYLESLSLMTSADGLLVIDAPAERSVFLPSKLIDYIGAGRPILGITPPGTASTLIREIGGWVADPTDVKSIAKHLEIFMTFLRQSASADGSIWGDPRVRSRFEASNVAHGFASILQEVAA